MTLFETETTRESDIQSTLSHYYNANEQLCHIDT